MYGIFTYICPKNDPNVGKYSIHGASGFKDGSMFVTFSPTRWVVPLGNFPVTSYGPVTSGILIHIPWRIRMYAILMVCNWPSTKTNQFCFLSIHGSIMGVYIYIYTYVYVSIIDCIKIYKAVLILSRWLVTIFVKSYPTETWHLPERGLVNVRSCNPLMVTNKNMVLTMDSWHNIVETNVNICV